jgi:hypothetical protein
MKGSLSDEDEGGTLCIDSAAETSTTASHGNREGIQQISTQFEPNVTLES